MGRPRFRQEVSHGKASASRSPARRCPPALVDRCNKEGHNRPQRMPQTPSDPHHDYPLVGETLGLWRLTNGLGRGGMGEVYEAEYDYVHLLSLRLAGEGREQVRRELEGLPRAAQAKVAAEVLGSDLPPDVRFAIKICNARTGTPGHRRFIQEADLAQRLGDHPYIVSVHSIHRGSDDMSELARRFGLDQSRHRDAAFMVMDLARRSYDHGRLSIGEAVHIVRCIATALDHAHSKGVVHRDLKPENILGNVEHPLLTDFGIAKEMEHTDGLTRTGQIIGTLDYMSPEQATDAKRAEYRSDIYSLGVVLYEFATQGQLPYQHKQDRDSCLAAIRSERDEPKWPREHARNFPPGLERIILKAMAWRPEDRYQAMSEFITDLDRFTRGEWISPWGRVRFRSWLRYYVRAHPRTLWSLALISVAGLGVAASVWLPRLFDKERSSLEGRLNGLAQAAEVLAEPDAPVPSVQLPAPAQESLDTLRQSLASDQSYGDLRDRLVGIEKTLRERLRFHALFGPRTADQKAADTARDALQQAARASAPSWYIDPRDRRLVMRDLQALRLAPYGSGQVYVRLTVGLDRGGPLSVEVTEAERPEHRLVWNLSGDTLRLTMNGVEVCTDTVDGRRLDLALHATATGLRTSVNDPRVRLHAVPGLRAGAPAAVRLVLPAGAAVERVMVYPRDPRPSQTP
jgi:serine/threonine protein kinase